ncbi:hypothetical protein, partial [Arthrobacter sp. HLT1-21]
IAAHAVEYQNVAVVGESDQRLNLAGTNSETADRDPAGGDPVNGGLVNGGLVNGGPVGGALNRTGCRDNAEYLRNTLRVSKSEAKRRIR